MGAESIKGTGKVLSDKEVKVEASVKGKISRIAFKDSMAFKFVLAKQ